MPAILKTTNKVSNFLAREQWRDRNWCREDVQVDLTGRATLGPYQIVGQEIVRVGTVLMQVNKTGAFVAATSAFNPANDRIGVIVDERVGDPTFMNGTDMKGNTGALGYGLQSPMNWGSTATSTPTLALIVKGDAIMRQGGLITSTIVDTVLATALKAQGIEVVTQLSGLYSTDRKRPFRKL